MKPKESLPFDQEVEQFLRDTMKAAKKVEDLYLRVEVAKQAIQWWNVINKTGGGSDSEGALLDQYKQFFTPAGERAGSTGHTNGAAAVNAAQHATSEGDGAEAN